MQNENFFFPFRERQKLQSQDTLNLKNYFKLLFSS